MEGSSSIQTSDNKKKRKDRKEYFRNWYLKNVKPRLAEINAKPCNVANRKRYYERNKKKTIQRQRERKAENLSSYILSRIKYKAKIKGLDFDLTKEDLEPLPTHCPVFGIELTPPSGNKVQPTSYSVDRIDNKKGYVKGNVVIVSFKANALKNYMTLEEIQQMAKFYCQFLNTVEGGFVVDPNI